MARQGIAGLLIKDLRIAVTTRLPTAMVPMIAMVHNINP